jgi:hypothetical protein
MHSRFKHSGDLGDIIFSLPVIRALGGGVLFLDPDGGQSSPLVNWAGATSTKLALHLDPGSAEPTLLTELPGKTRTNLAAAAIASLRPLLLQQEYINDVQSWKGQAIDHDLDAFRQHLGFNNLSDSHLAAFGLPFAERDRAWITVDQPISVDGHPIVIARSPRYHSNFGFWESILPLIKDRCVYVGHPKEHEYFVYTFGHQVMRLPTPDILTLGRVIAGCRQFIGNVGFSHALAEAMKKDLINEVYRVNPTAMFQRSGAQYV